MTVPKPNRVKVGRNSEGSANLLRILTTLADAGEPCPSTERLAFLTGYACDATARAALNRLRTIGAITWTLGGVFRVVTITATGKSTSDVPPPHLAAGLKKGGRKAKPKPDVPAKPLAKRSWGYGKQVMNGGGPVGHAERAAQHLQRDGYAPVCRVKTRDPRDKTGDWFVGAARMAEAEMVAKAKGRGFDPDAWRAIPGQGQEARP